MKNIRITRSDLLAFAAGALLAISAASPALAQVSATFTTLHGFVRADGTAPAPGLVQGTDGNFYGSNISGGAGSVGTVFKMTPGGVVTVLHSFKSDYTDGALPNGRLAQGADGNFYGTTRGGGVLGSVGQGTVFRITPDGVLTTLYNFPTDNPNLNGQAPTAGLTLGSDGNFYGTTTSGGASGSNSGNGTVFRITPAGTLTTIHSFLFDDGQAPFSGVTEGPDGNFYGTTYQGGTNGRGVIYKITPGGVFTVLHHFGDGEDGSSSQSELTLGRDGDLYGVANYIAFKITINGVLTTLHSFSGNSDGHFPRCALVQGGDGNLYGTTTKGGTNDNGTIFQMTPAGVVTTLYRFTGGADGSFPNGSLIQATDGKFYGLTTYGNGTDTYGTAYSLAVSSHPAFFAGETALSNGVYYLQFTGSGNPFGYYSYLTDQNYIYHFDLGYEYVFDAADGHVGVYLYDFKSGGFFYTSPTFPFPYLYDFTLNSTLYYYPDPGNAGHYNTNGIRYFYEFANGQIISK